MRSNRIWLIVFGITTILFWILLDWNLELLSLPRLYGLSNTEFVVGFMKSIGKFLFYVNLILWFNSVFILKTRAEGIDTETWEFQKRQVYMTLSVFVVLIVMEIPIWLSVL